MPTPEEPTAPIARARLAVSTMFFVNGVVLASWVPHIPAVKARHAISDGELGGVLFAMAVGAVVALPMAGWLVGRFGSRRMTSIAAVGLCLCLPLPVLAPTVALLVLSLGALGAFNATLDVSMNAQAVVVEQRYGRPIMSSFHGLFSLGMLAGAGAAVAVMAAGPSDASHVVGAALVALLAVGPNLKSLVPTPARALGGGRVFAVPGRALLALGALAFCGLLVEGAMGDWTAVYLHDTLGNGAALAGTGFAAFSLAMASGRFAGDRLVAGLGAPRVLRAFSTAAAIGLVAALILGDAPSAVVGFGMVGLGIANVVPILFSAAAGVPGVEAGHAIAGVATVGYLGLLAGPPLIGVVADAVGLRLALGVVAALCAVLALGAGSVGRETTAAGDGGPRRLAAAIGR
jgi:fucose permease